MKSVHITQYAPGCFVNWISILLKKKNLFVQNMLLVWKNKFVTLLKRNKQISILKYIFYSNRFRKQMWFKCKQRLEISRVYLQTEYQKWWRGELIITCEGPEGYFFPSLSTRYFCSTESNRQITSLSSRRNIYNHFKILLHSSPHFPD